MMYDGKMRWSRNRRGGWYTFAHYNEDFFYTANRHHGGWNLTFGQRFFGEPTWLGWFIYLKDAKQAADFHHHTKIREHGNDNLKAYIERYPIEQLDPTNL